MKVVLMPVSGFAIVRRPVYTRRQRVLKSSYEFTSAQIQVRIARC